MLKDDYRYAIELFKEGGRSLGRVPVQIDWDPAVEWVRFLGMRQGRLPPVLSAGRGMVQPIWHPKLHQPYLAGFRVIAFADGGTEQVSGEIPLSYLKDPARQVSTGFVERGELAPGEYSRYVVLAYPADGHPAGDPGTAQAGFSIEALARPLPLRDGSLRSFLCESMPFGQVDAGDVPVFIPRNVLDEAIVLTRQAGAKETGGILIGHLHRDADIPEISAVVTVQIPARHARSELTSLTFTAETWTAVRDAIDLRRQGEVYLGWWHSHSFLKEKCKDCEEYKAGTCSMNAAFMSADDCALHRTVFGQAYSVALVISDSPCSGLIWQLFGWWYGMIVPRGFYVLRRPGLRPEAEAPASVAGGDANAAES